MAQQKFLRFDDGEFTANANREGHLVRTEGILTPREFFKD